MNKKTKQILAWIGIVILVGMYVCALVFSFMDSPMAQTLFRAAIAATFIVPVLLYAFLLVAKNQKPDKSPIIDTVVFDVGGVLLDTPWGRYLDENDYSEDVKKALFENVIMSVVWGDMDAGARPYDEIVEEFCKENPNEADGIRRFMYSFAEFVAPFPYTDAWLSDLKHKGYRLVLLSNWGEGIYYQLREKGIMEFENQMDDAIWSFEHHVCKPDPKIFEIAVKKYHVVPERAVFIDNTEENVVAAQKAGFYAIHFKDFQETVRKLAALGVK